MIHKSKCKFKEFINREYKGKVIKDDLIAGCHACVQDGRVSYSMG